MAESTGYDRSTPVAFVAAGRLGSSLAIALAAAGYRIASLSSRRREHREWLAGKLPGAHIVETAREAAKHGVIVFIASPDGVVESICREIDWRRDQAVIHCAGALSLSALASASEQGAATGGFHPMQTFPAPDASDRLQGVTFAIEADNPALETWLRRVAADLGGRAIAITGVQRSAYHASAVMSAGLLSGLAGLAAGMWDRLGLNREEGIRSLAPLIQSTAAYIGEKGIPDAITGPYVRGDVETIRQHIAVTRAQSPETGAAYAALALASLPIAAEQGGLTPEAQREIRTMLKQGLADAARDLNGG